MKRKHHIVTIYLRDEPLRQALIRRQQEERRRTGRPVSRSEVIRQILKRAIGEEKV